MGEVKEGRSLISILTSGRWSTGGGVVDRRKLPGAM
jgi:hypothetical protein